MNESNENFYLTTAPIKKLLIKFSIPCVLAMLVSALYNIVDQIFIGQGVGYLGNAATNIIFPIVIMCNAIAGLIGNGCAANFSLRLGEGKKEEAENTKKLVGQMAQELKEMEEKEAELERIAEEARKRKEARKAIPLQTDYKDDNLAGLDHYFDRDVKKDAAAKEANGTKKENEVKIINFSDYSKRK